VGDCWPYMTHTVPQRSQTTPSPQPRTPGSRRWESRLSRRIGPRSHSAGPTDRRSFSGRPTRAGRRVVGIPKSIVPALEQHLSKFVGPEPGALVFCGPSGVPLRRSNFGKMSGWPHAVRSIGAEGLHVHDLRHTGNTFGAAGGTGIKDRMARMGHDSERAALIYLRARGADKIITDNFDAHVEAERKRKEDGDDGTGPSWCRSANGPLMAQSMISHATEAASNARISPLTRAGTM
jgi:hypothetical protein